MTCIIGIAEQGTVYMGGDSMSASTWDKNITALHKVFQLGEFLIGYSSSFRMGQILQHHLAVRTQDEGESDEHYLVVHFIEAVRTVLKDKGFSRVDNNQEGGGSFLLGYRGKVYLIDSDFQLNCFVNGLAAVGVGEPYALAAVTALSDLPPIERIRRALEITETLCNGVCAPFYIETL